MKVNNHTLKTKYGVTQTVISILGTLMVSKHLSYQLKYEDVSVKESDYQYAKVQNKKLRVFDIVDAVDAIVLRLSKANASTKGNERKSIPILERAFTELYRVLKTIEKENND